MADADLDERQKARKEAYKAGIDVQDARKQRQRTTVSLRRKKRNERMKKQRQLRSRGAEEADVAAEAGFGLDENGEQKIDRLPIMMEHLVSNDPTLVFSSCQLFRKLLSIETNPPIDLVINAGAVPYFVRFLEQHDMPNLQFEAAWALTNISSGLSRQTKVVLEHQAVPILVDLLATGTPNVREQVVWCLGNIAGDSTECRDYVLHYNVMEPLLHNLVATVKLSMMRNATWTLSNLCRGKPQPKWSQVSQALPTLGRLIYTNDDEVLTDALWALSYLSDGSDARIQQVIDAGVCRRVVEMLTHVSPAVQVPALRTVGNIVTGNDMQTQCMLNSAVLPCLLFLLNSGKENIKKEACWTISNITAGSKSQIKAVIDAGLIPPLIAILNESQYFKTRKEAAWAISNLTSGGSPEHIRYIVSRGAIKPLCDLLLVSDARVSLVAMEGLENILKVGELDAASVGFNPFAALIDEAEGTEKLHYLQNHQNVEIYKKSLHICTTYFAGSESDDELDADTNDMGQFGFGQGAPQKPSGGYQF